MDQKKAMLQWLSHMRGHQFKIYFHLCTLTHHLFVAYFLNFQVQIEKYIHDDRQIWIMVEHAVWYLTSWNFLLQCFYFALSLAHDLLHLSELHNLQVIKMKIEPIKCYIFRVIAFPLALAVCAKFWTLHSIDSSLVFPTKFKEIFPSWCNHAVHSHIVVAVLIEIAITYHHYSPSRSKRNEIYVMSFVSFLYMFCLCGIYFYYDVWLYPVYKMMNWAQRILLMLATYVFSYLMYEFGEHISSLLWKNNHYLNSKSS